jgi:HSP20 family protein
MSKLPAQRQSRSLLPDLSDLLAAFPPFAGLRPIFDSHLIRLEDDIKDGYYELRAELPGIDPAEDVEITVRDGQLKIKGERANKDGSNGRSEFSYGSFARSVSLPAGADEDDITATYDKGILTISVPISDADPTEKHVPVQSIDGEAQDQYTEPDELDESEEPDTEVEAAEPADRADG